MPTHEQLTAIFAEWDRRAAEGKWQDNAPDPDASAAIFAEIARELFPELGRV